MRELTENLSFLRMFLVQVSCHAILKTPLCSVRKTQKPWTEGFGHQKSFHVPPRVSPEIQRLKTIGQSSAMCYIQPPTIDHASTLPHHL